MLKRILFVFLIIASIFAIFWSTNYIYEKQYFSSNYYDYLIEDDAQIIYIPNVNKLLKKEIKIPISQNHQLFDILNNKQSYSFFDFNKKISPSVFISYTENNFNFIFNNNNLNIQKIITELNDNFNVSSEISNLHCFKIENITYYYLKTSTYFIISTQPILIQNKGNQFKFRGNFDYLTQSQFKAYPIYFKQTNNQLYTFWFSDSLHIKGKPVNLFPLLKFIPNNFDTLRFYGSTRFETDKYQLLDIKNDTNNFYNWVNEGIIHLKKGENELLIGNQNEGQFLKYILEEQTLTLSKDSILSTPLYKSNFEILFFETSFNWCELLPNTKGNFNIFTSYNNINILANSSKSLDWYIKEIQLGNTGDKLQLEDIIPQKVNKTEIFKTDSHFVYLNSVKINQNQVLNSKIESKYDITKKHDNNISIINEVFINETVKKINVLNDGDSNYICLVSNNTILCTNINGDSLWRYSSNGIIKANETIKENNTYLAVLEQNQINLINIKTGETKSNFPFKLSSPSNDLLVVKYKNNGDYRLLFDQNSKIININTIGQKVDGWNEFKFAGTLKSNISYLHNNQKDYIYFKSSFDTIYVLNRKGEDRFLKHFKISLPNECPYISVSQNDNLSAIGYQNNYIFSFNLLNGFIDSIKSEINLNPINIHWTNNGNSIFLNIETYEYLYILTKFGMIEREIQKPQPNLNFVNSKNQSLNWFIFANFNNNDIYLLNNFGTLINTTPLKGNDLSIYYNGYVISFMNSKLIIYKVN